MGHQHSTDSTNVQYHHLLREKFCRDNKSLYTLEYLDGHGKPVQGRGMYDTDGILMSVFSYYVLGYDGLDWAFGLLMTEALCFTPLELQLQPQVDPHAVALSRAARSKIVSLTGTGSTSAAGGLWNMLWGNSKKEQYSPTTKLGDNFSSDPSRSKLSFSVQYEDWVWDSFWEALRSRGQYCLCCGNPEAMAIVYAAAIDDQEVLKFYLPELFPSENEMAAKTKNGVGASSSFAPAITIADDNLFRDQIKELVETGSVTTKKKAPPVAPGSLAHLAPLSSVPLGPSLSSSSSSSSSSSTKGPSSTTASAASPSHQTTLTDAERWYRCACGASLGGHVGLLKKLYTPISVAGFERELMSCASVFHLINVVKYLTSVSPAAPSVHWALMHKSTKLAKWILDKYCGDNALTFKTLMNEEFSTISSATMGLYERRLDRVTPLWLACHFGNLPILKMIVEKSQALGVPLNFNRRSGDGDTPFITACKSGFANLSFFQYLVTSLFPLGMTTVDESYSGAGPLLALRWGWSNTRSTSVNRDWNTAKCMDPEGLEILRFIATQVPGMDINGPCIFKLGQPQEGGDSIVQHLSRDGAKRDKGAIEVLIQCGAEPVDDVVSAAAGIDGTTTSIFGKKLGVVDDPDRA